MQDLTADQLVRALQEQIKADPAAGHLPATAIDLEGRLVNIVDVNTSRMHGGLVMLQARDYDRPRKSSTPNPSTSDVQGDGEPRSGVQQPVVLRPVH